MTPNKLSIGNSKKTQDLHLCNTEKINYGHLNIKQAPKILSQNHQHLNSDIYLSMFSMAPLFYQNAKYLIQPQAQNKSGIWLNLKSHKKKTCIISNDIIQGSTPDNEFFINSIIWGTDKNSDTKISIAHGVYAHFTYKGQIDDYVCYINNIYLNTLSFYSLQRKNILDLEVISRATGDDFYFEYFLPIENKDIHEESIHYTTPLFLSQTDEHHSIKFATKNIFQERK